MSAAIDNFWKYCDVLILGAALSAAIWSIVWLFGFGILIALSVSYNLPTETTAMAISFAVLLGHLPKFIATFLGTDTDFQDFREQIGSFSLRHVPWRRVIMAATLIWLIMSILIPGRVSVLVTPIEPLDIGPFVEVTYEAAFVCLALFGIQAIFSWPKEINDVKTGRSL